MGTVKTSAISKSNVAVIEQSGKVGTVRYVQRNGFTYVRSAHNAVVTNNRTDKQMDQRLRWASLSAFWSKIGSKLTGSFQNKLRNQSDFNVFMQLNQDQGCYIDKQEKLAGYVIALPCLIAQGSLRGITAAYADTTIDTSLAVSASTSDVSTIAKLTNAILASNQGFSEGDQITMVALKTDEDGYLDYCEYKRVVLNLLNTEAPEIPFTAADGCLKVASEGIAGVAFIHTNGYRKSSNATIVLGEGALAMLEAYTTDEQWQIARDSYGKSSSTYLMPSSEGEGGDTPVTAKYNLTVQVSPVGGGTVTGIKNPYAAGSSASITAVPASGKVFDSWSDGTQGATRTVLMDSDKVLMAVFRNG